MNEIKNELEKKECGDIGNQKSKYLNLINKKVGKLTILSKSDETDKRRNIKFNCLCECGIKTVVFGSNLKRRHTLSCGKCVQKGNESIDMIGMKFGKLTVISKSVKRNKRGITFWNCLCSCGNNKEICRSELKNKITNSCGCLKIEYQNDSRNLDSAFQRLLRTYKKGALNRKYIFDLEESDFRKLTSSDCRYCGSEPKQIVYAGRKKDEKYCYKYNGIDRINNDIGYHIDNCIPCCSKCNTMKMDLEQNFFIEHIESIYNFLKSGNNRNIINER